MTGSEMPDPKDLLLDAALMHVPFDGWTEVTWEAALADVDVNPVVANALCPRGALDLAVAYHPRGDALMLDRLEAADLGEMRAATQPSWLSRSACSPQPTGREPGHTHRP